MFNVKKLISNNPDKEYPSNMGVKWNDDESSLLLEEIKKIYILKQLQKIMVELLVELMHV